MVPLVSVNTAQHHLTTAQHVHISCPNPTTLVSRIHSREDVALVEDKTLLFILSYPESCTLC
jgi:hypothetical protein